MWYDLKCNYVILKKTNNIFHNFSNVLFSGYFGTSVLSEWQYLPFNSLHSSMASSTMYFVFEVHIAMDFSQQKTEAL